MNKYFHVVIIFLFLFPSVYLAGQVEVLSDGSVKLHKLDPLSTPQDLLGVNNDHIVKIISINSLLSGITHDIDHLDDGRSDKLSIVFLGENAGINNTGINNTGVGIGALKQNTSGFRNSAFGVQSLAANRGSYNAAFGSFSLRDNTSGDRNAGFGDTALASNTEGHENVAVGFHAAHNNRKGSYNSAVGSEALFHNKLESSEYNTAIGYRSLFNTGLDSRRRTIGRNTALGAMSLMESVKGHDNVGIGYRAGYSLQGNSNIVIGSNTNVPSATGDHQINIGDVIFKTTDDNVGIFTSAPVTNFHVNGNIHASGAYWDSSTNPGTSGQILSSTGSGTAWIDASNVGGGSHTGQLGSIFFAGSNGGEPTEDNGQLFWDDTNNWLGVGTSTPSVKLHVNGHVRAWNYRAGNGTPGTPTFRFTSDPNTGIFRPGSDRLGFTTAGHERLRIDNLGNVGIGTSSPTERLDIATGFASTHVKTFKYGLETAFLGSGGWRRGFRITGEAEGKSTVFAGSTGGDAYIATGYSIANDELGVNSKVITFKANKNIGIGTTVPTEKLEVAGNIKVTGSYKDSNGDAGAVGQVLSSTATGTDWIDASSGGGFAGIQWSIPFVGTGGSLSENNAKLQWNNSLSRLSVDGEIYLPTSKLQMKQQQNGTVFISNSQYAMFIRSDGVSQGVGEVSIPNLTASEGQILSQTFVAANTPSNIIDRNVIQLNSSTTISFSDLQALQVGASRKIRNMSGEKIVIVLENASYINGKSTDQIDIPANATVEILKQNNYKWLIISNFNTTRRPTIGQSFAKQYVIATINGSYMFALKTGEFGYIENPTTSVLTIGCPNGILYFDKGNSSPTITIAPHETVSFIFDGVNRFRITNRY